MTTTTSPAPPRIDDASLKRATDALWRAGDLTYKLDEGRPSGPQRRFYNKSRKCNSKTFVTEDARRLGKTYGHAIIGFELALKNPGRRINWCQDTAKGVRDMAVPLFEKIAKDAPPDCKPEWKDNRSVMAFPNGAYIFVFGGDTQADADNARGGDDPIASFVDEGGFIALLKYIYRSILKPAHRRVKRRGHFGMIFIVSSTPEDLDHYFIELAGINEVKGSYIREDIYASADPEAYIAEEAQDLALTVEQFMRTDEFKREFLCLRVIRSDVVVFPEFTEAKDRSERSLVQDWPRPLGFEQYIYKRTGVDPGGMRDPTGILSGYVDFTNARIVIEGERLMPRPNTKDIADAIVELETELWGPPPEPTQPGETPPDRDRVSRRVDDATGRVTLDLWEIHKLRCEPAVKNDRNASIGLIRTYLLNGTLVVHPRCVQLLHQLQYAKNNATRTDFLRNDKGHCDLAAALMYFVRDLNLITNPYPADFDQLTGRAMPDNHVIMIRREEMGVGRDKQGLAAALLSGNRFVQGQLKRHR
jgi:hypothetical protein